MTVHYFVVMIRNGAHVIFTQLVSTHDPMVRGSLDFPNLINLKNITNNFQVELEIYGMVSLLKFINNQIYIFIISEISCLSFALYNVQQRGLPF